MELYKVYDSLGNKMGIFKNKKDALNHKAIFGNSKWYINEISSYSKEKRS